MMADDLPSSERRPVPVAFALFPDSPSRIGCGVEAHVAKPTADERDVDACRDEVDGGGMAEAVWRCMLRSQRWHSFSNSSAGRMTAEVC